MRVLLVVLLITIHWFYVNWMIDFPSVSDMHINLKELFTVLLALRRWGHQWKNTYLHIYTDNMATKYVLNKGSMRNNIGMDFLREIYCILAMNNINIVAKYLTSKDNIVVDNENFALAAAEIVLEHNDFILHLCFDWSTHVSYECFQYLLQTLSLLSKDIWTKMLNLRQSIFAKSTKATYKSHLRSFLRFCLYFGYEPLACTVETICRYIAFLARSLSYSSIPGYLNIIRLLHVDSDN